MMIGRDAPPATTDITEVSSRLWGMWSYPVEQLRNWCSQRAFCCVQLCNQTPFLTLLIPGWEQEALLHLLQSTFNTEITVILVVTSSYNSSMFPCTSLFLWVYLKTCLPWRCLFSTLFLYQWSERVALDCLFWNVCLLSAVISYLDGCDGLALASI